MKTSPARNFGVQSYCFRETTDNARVASMVKEIGLDQIEVCEIHADFTDLVAWRDIVKTYQDAGVTICSIGVQTFTGADEELTWFECAAAAGATHISAHFQIDSFASAIPKVKQWCEEFGIRVGIHCHGGYMFGGSPDVLEHLLQLGAPHIGLCIDTAWCMQIGPQRGNPIEWVEQFGGQIFGVHYKDFTFNADGSWQDVIVGEGTLKLPAFIHALEQANFNGMTVIEYEGDPQDPVPALKRCVERMRTATL